MRRAVGLLAILALMATAQINVTRTDHSAGVSAATLQSESSPKILNVRRSGKNLLVSGESFQAGAVIIINGERQKTRNDEDDPASLLVAKKAAKRLPPDAVVTIEVENSAAAKSDPFAFFTGLTLTVEDAGKTFHLKSGEQFLLLVKTDSRFDITATVVDQAVVKKVADGSGIPDAQAIYEAQRDGQTQLSVALDPKCAPALAYLGVTYATQGSYAEAVEAYEKSLAINDRVAVVHYLAADAILSEAAGDTAKAEAHLTRALALDPALSTARLARAKIYMRSNRFAEAAGELERVAAAEPNLAAAHYQLGRAYIRLKRKAEGDAELEKFKALSDSEKEQAQNQQRDIMRRLANVRF